VPLIVATKDPYENVHQAHRAKEGAHVAERKHHVVGICGWRILVIFATYPATNSLYGSVRLFSTMLFGLPAAHTDTIKTKQNCIVSYMAYKIGSMRGPSTRTAGNSQCACSQRVPAHAAKMVLEEMDTSSNPSALDKVVSIASAAVSNAMSRPSTLGKVANNAHVFSCVFE